jgi:hypothetical protein
MKRIPYLPAGDVSTGWGRLNLQTRNVLQAKFNLPWNAEPFADAHTGDAATRQNGLRLSLAQRGRHRDAGMKQVARNRQLFHARNTP